MKYWMVWWFNSSENLQPEDSLMGVSMTLADAESLMELINSNLDSKDSRLSGDRIYIQEVTVIKGGAIQ
jgi:hypothetical protein